MADTTKATAQRAADTIGAAQAAAAAASAGPERATVTEATQAAATKADRSGELVYVGCKLPNGVTLDLDQFVAVNDKGDVRVKKGRLPPVTLRGWAYAVGLEAPLIGPGGYVSTPVPREFWREWHKRNHDGDLMRSGMIIVSDAQADLNAQATEKGELKRVFAPLVPSKKADGVEIATKDNGQPLLDSARALM